jgi:endonuclease YncB( thermonuclease family)
MRPSDGPSGVGMGTGLRIVAALLCCTSLIAATNARAGSCLENLGEARAAVVADARSLALKGGPVVKLAGIESFALLDQGDRAEAALRGRLEALAASGPVRFEPVDDKPDRYGRIPALVESGSGAILQEDVAGDGVALAYGSGKPIPCFDRILAAENRARRAGRGFWSTVKVPRAKPEALRPRIGRFAIFEGAVVTVGNRRSRTYLNFGRRWSEDVTVEIAANDRNRFGGEEALALLAGRHVRVRGFVSEHGGPVVTVTSPMQIETLPAASPRSKP